MAVGSAGVLENDERPSWEEAESGKLEVDLAGLKVVEKASGKSDSCGGFGNALSQSFRCWPCVFVVTKESKSQRAAFGVLRRNSLRQAPGALVAAPTAFGAWSRRGLCTRVAMPQGQADFEDSCFLDIFCHK